MRYNFFMSNKYEALQLKNQLCFPFYACANKIMKRYRKLLKYLDLTYTQYLVMAVLWEIDGINVSTICSLLLLETNTITPVIKKLETKGLVKKEKDKKDARNYVVSLTEKGLELKEKSIQVPPNIIKKVNLSNEEKEELKKYLYRILEEVDE